MIGSGLSYPAGVAVDGNGNVYVSDTGTDLVYKETLSAGNYTQSTVASSSLSHPFGAAVDGAGNVYIADSFNSLVRKEDHGDAPSLTFEATNVGFESGDSPQSVTVLNFGNAALTASGYGSNALDFSVEAGSGTPPDCTTTFSLAANATCNLSIIFVPTIQGALIESMTLTDNALNVPSATQNITLNGFGNSVGPPPPTVDTTSLAVGIVPSSLLVGQVATITATVSDITNGGITPTGAVTFTDTVGITTTNLNGGSAVALNGGGVATLYPVTLIGIGTHTINATYSDGAGGSNFQGSTNSNTVSLSAYTTTTTTLAFLPPTPVASGNGRDLYGHGIQRLSSDHRVGNVLRRYDDYRYRARLALPVPTTVPVSVKLPATPDGVIVVVVGNGTEAELTSPSGTAVI
jgi:hypothetical protein